MTQFNITPTGTYKQFSDLPAVPPGSKVLFQRGFSYDKIDLAGLDDVEIGFYGVGSDPVISVMETASAFTDIGGGLWTFAADTNILIIDGITQKKGRFPKDESEYFDITADSIVNGSGEDFYLDHGVLPFTPSGEVVIRLQAFITNTYDVTGNTASTLEYTPQSGQYPPKAGYGFALQNQVECLTEVGDWMCIAGVVTVYLGAQNPNEFTFQYPTETNALTVSNSTNINLDGLVFRGGREDVGLVSDSSNITFTSCKASWGAGMGIRVINSSNFIMFNEVRIDHCYTGGLYSDFLINNVTALNCEVYDVGLVEGGSPLMNGDGRSHGICFELGTNNLIDSCTVKRAGFNGFVYLGSGTRVINSFADGFNLKKNDGGGFYTSIGVGTIVITEQMELHKCIAINGVGNIYGTPADSPNCQGIYSDDNIYGLKVSECLSAFNPTGLYIHNTVNSEFSNITLYGNNRQLNIVQDSGLDLNGLIYSNNWHITTALNQEMAFAFGLPANIANFGVFQNNKYSNFNTARPIFGTWSGVGAQPYRYEIDIPNWTALVGETLVTYENYETLPYTIVQEIGSINYQTTEPVWPDFGLIGGVDTSRDGNGMEISKAGAAKTVGFLRVNEVTAATWYLIYGEATGDFANAGQDFESNYVSPATYEKSLKITTDTFALPIYSAIDRATEQLVLYLEENFTSMTLLNIAMAEINVERTESLAELVINENLMTFNVYLDGNVPPISLGNNQILDLDTSIAPIITLNGIGRGAVFKNQTRLTIEIIVGEMINGVASAQIAYIKSTGATGSFTATIDEENQKVYYLIQSELDVDVSGDWRFWAKLTYNDGKKIASSAVVVPIYEEGSK